MILAIETSTPVCSVTLMKNLRMIEKRSTGKGEHSEKLFLFIDELLSRQKSTVSDLTAILLNKGPGSYTGLRIGAAAVKGLLFQQELPLYSLQSLHCIAAGAAASKRPYKTIHAVIDARRNHLYHQKFSVVNNIPVPEGEPAVKEIEEIDQSVEKGDLIAGTGIERLNVYSEPDIYCLHEAVVSANNLALMYQNEDSRKYLKREDPVTFEPFYLTMNQIVNNTKKEPE